MDKYEDDIHNCTNERLAEMLEFVAARINILPHEEQETVHEAARRLRFIANTRTMFNHEQFNM